MVEDSYCMSHLALAIPYPKTNQQFNVTHSLQEFQKNNFKKSEVNIGQVHGSQARRNFHTLVTSLARSETSSSMRNLMTTR
jgi:hypothetical protein